MIPLLLVSGFLGSGKTTLLQHLLLDARARKIKVALIINEFGAADVDGTLLRGGAYASLATLAGGCACCGGQDEFVAALQELGTREGDARPDVIVVEASGLADILLLLESIADPQLLGLVWPQTLISVLDVLRWEQVQDWAGSLVQHQIMLADFLLVNKADEVEAVRVDALVRVLRAVRPLARVIPTSYSQMEWEPVWQSVSASPHSRRQLPPGGLAPGQHSEGSTPAGGHLGAHAVLCPVPHPVDLSMLEAALKNLPDHVWRCKGFLRVRGREGLQLCQYTGGPDRRWHLAPYHLPHGYPEPHLQLVFLGADLDEAALHSGFGGHALMGY